MNFYQFAYHYHFGDVPEGFAKDAAVARIQKHEPLPSKTFENFFTVLLLCLERDPRFCPMAVRFSKHAHDMKKLLKGYDPREIAKLNAGALYEGFSHIFLIGNKEWSDFFHRFASAIMDGATFLASFKTPQAFLSFVESFQGTPDTRVALPVYLFSLMPNVPMSVLLQWLQWLGNLSYCNPDPAVIEVMHLLDSDVKNAISALRAMNVLAGHCHVSVYSLNELLSSICGGGKDIGLLEKPVYAKRRFETAIAEWKKTHSGYRELF